MSTNWSTFSTHKFSLSLEKGETRIFVLDDEDSFRSPDAHLFTYLNDTEKARYHKIQHSRSRCEFLAGRWLIKSLISTFASIEVSKIELKALDHGKLFWASSPEDRPFYFNLSHSGGAVAVVCSTTGNVGIDIENSQREIQSYQELASRFYSPEECRWVVETTELSWDRFLSLFVQKESFLKATGKGLSSDMEKVSTNFQYPPFQNDENYLFRTGKENRLFGCARSLYSTQVWKLDEIEIHSEKGTEISSFGASD